MQILVKFELFRQTFLPTPIHFNPPIYDFSNPPNYSGPPTIRVGRVLVDSKNDSSHNAVTSSDAISSKVIVRVYKAT